MKLRDLTVMITGATSGVGLSLTEAFIENGNKVIAIGRNQPVLDDLQQKFKANVHTIQGDLSTRGGIDSILQQVETNFSSIDVLINNAAVQYNYDFFESAEAIFQIQNEVTTNLTAPILLTALLLPLMENSATPAIVNVTSGLALQPKMSAPVYCATKAGLHVFTRALRYQFEKSKVKVFELMLPLVDTPMTRDRSKGKLSPDDVAKKLINGMKKDRYELYIGKVKLLRFLVRWFPFLAEKALKDS